MGFMVRLKRFVSCVRAAILGATYGAREGWRKAIASFDESRSPDAEDSAPVHKKPDLIWDGVQCRCKDPGSIADFIEPCIRDLVDCLNRHGIRTYSSCCGHGITQGSIRIDSTSVEPFNAGYLLKTSKQPIKVPFDMGKRQWLGRDEYGSGWHSDWYRRKPYERR